MLYKSHMHKYIKLKVNYLMNECDYTGQHVCTSVMKYTVIRGCKGL